MRGAIDKVDAYLHEDVNIDHLKKRLKKLGIAYAHERIGTKRDHALRVGDQSGEHFYLELKWQSSTHGNKVISNPSHFRSFRSYKEFLIKVFGRNQYESLLLYRLDVCVDIGLPFQNLKRWIRVPHKQYSRSDTNKGRLRTGVTFGKGSLIICIYDKTAEQLRKGIETDGPITRIEVRFTGDKKPVMYVKDLPEILDRDSEGKLFAPFKSISIEPIHLVPVESVTDRDRLIKWVRLDTYLEIGGYDLAYKQLNEHGNFRRDVRGLASFEEYPHDLNEVLIADLELFFGQARRRPRHEF